MLVKHPDDVEQAMRFTFGSRNERQLRLYAAAEAVKLRRGGVPYLSSLFAGDRKTIYRGLCEQLLKNSGDTAFAFASRWWCNFCSVIV